MIYITSPKKIKKTLKSFKKTKKVVINTPSEKEIFRRLEADPDTHIILMMEISDADATATVLSKYSGIPEDDLKKIIFDADDKKSLAKDLAKHSEEIFKKIDAKIEKAKEKCENTSELREKRGELYDVTEGEANKSDTLAMHAKYRKLPKKLIKKINKIKSINDGFFDKALKKVGELE